MAFLTDLHTGATAGGWSQQRRWAGGLPDLFDGLREWIRDGGISQIVIGGDLTEHGTPGEIETVLGEIDRLGAPSLVVLGNHDFAQTDSPATWQAAVSRHPAVQLADAVVPAGDWDLIAVNHPWAGAQGPAFHWDPCGPGPVAAVDPGCIAFLEQALAASPDRPAILILHAPLDPLPPRLTGLPHPIHGEPEAFVRPILDLLERSPRVRLVLTGHCHVQCITDHTGRLHVSSSAFAETPFEVRLIELEAGSAILTTHALTAPANAPMPDPAKMWVLGQPQDRAARIAAAPAANPGSDADLTPRAR